MPIDYRTILTKYIAHVGSEEGITYIDTADPDGYGPVNPRNPVTFTAEEFAALRECGDDRRFG